MIVEKTLKDLVAGDKVIRKGGSFSDKSSVVTVKRITNTQIIVDGAMKGTEIKFRKDNGREIGASHYYYVSRIIVATDEALQEFQFEEKYKSLYGLQLRISKEQKELIEDVYNFLKSKELIN